MCGVQAFLTVAVAGKVRNRKQHKPTGAGCHRFRLHDLELLVNHCLQLLKFKQVLRPALAHGLAWPLNAVLNARAAAGVRCMMKLTTPVYSLKCTPSCVPAGEVQGRPAELLLAVQAHMEYYQAKPDIAVFLHKPLRGQCCSDCRDKEIPLAVASRTPTPRVATAFLRKLGECDSVSYM